jgi:DNA-directed RNA polymerase specialized sigma24 family protein
MGTAALHSRVDADAPQPDRLASLAELIERLDGDLRRIVLLKRDGFTNEEISLRVNRSVATIERRLRLLRDEWMEELFG